MTVTEEGYSKSWRGNLARSTSNASITNVTPIVNKRLAPLQLGINTRGNYSGNLNAWPVLIASFPRRLTASQEISETIFPGFIQFTRAIDQQESSKQTYAENGRRRAKRNNGGKPEE